MIYLNPKELSPEDKRLILHPGLLTGMGIKYDSAYIDGDLEYRLEHACNRINQSSDKAFLLLMCDYHNPECYTIELMDERDEHDQ